MIIETRSTQQTPDGEIVQVVEFERKSTRLDRIIEGHAEKATKLLLTAQKTDAKIRAALSDIEELLATKVVRDSDPAQLLMFGSDTIAKNNRAKTAVENRRQAEKDEDDEKIYDIIAACAIHLANGSPLERIEEDLGVYESPNELTKVRKKAEKSRKKEHAVA